MSALLLVSSDKALASAVRNALEHGTGLIEIDHLLDGIEDRYSPDGVLIDSDVRNGVQTAFERIATAKRLFPSVPVIVLGNEMSAQLVLAALRAGAADFIDRATQSQQLKMSIHTVLAEAKNTQRHKHAKIAGILSALPCDQDQDFSLNLAMRAAKRMPGEMTVYIDLSAPATQSGIALGLDVDFGIADAIRELSRVDRALLESALAHDPQSGLHLLPFCPKFGTEVPMIEATSFSALLDVLRGICGMIVINYGPFSREKTLIAMVQPCARFFACCTQRFPSIRGTSDLMRWYAESRLGAPPELVVHALASGNTPTPADIRKALSVNYSIDLEEQWDEILESINRGKPFALKDTGYARNLDACLAHFGFEYKPEPNLMARLRGWVGLGLAAELS